MRVAAIGEAMIELSIDGDIARIGVAGDTLNTAIYLKRTAPDLDVDYVTRLGEDAFSRRIATFIQSERIGTDRIETDSGRTPGLYAISTDAAGERSFAYWRNDSAARQMFQTPDGPVFDALDGYDVIYLSGITLAILPPRTRASLMDWLADFRIRGGCVVYDSNHRPALWCDAATARRVNGDMWRIADIALPSVDDEAALMDETPDRVARRFLDMSIGGALKRGALGPLCLRTGNSRDYPAAPKVVDTTAAGDSFNGGYLGALLQGAKQEDALRAGHTLAAQVVGHKGAILPA